MSFGKLLSLETLKCGYPSPQSLRGFASKNNLFCVQLQLQSSAMSQLLV